MTVSRCQVTLAALSAISRLPAPVAVSRSSKRRARDTSPSAWISGATPPAGPDTTPAATPTANTASDRRDEDAWRCRLGGCPEFSEADAPAAGVSGASGAATVTPGRVAGGVG